MFKKPVRAAALLAAAAAVMFAAPAQAHLAPEESPHSEFALYLAPAGSGSELTTLTLECPGKESEHPNAKAACRQLQRAHGHIADIPPADGMCTKEYAPVVVLVHGHWHGDKRVFAEKYGNDCEAALATGGYLFDI
ncbi:SSI family serine proteinase inhibitor [Glycomyces buryatensis]|nr:SSI family serine proteinase inhibitor [Glycomyces buryatensis]